MLGCAHIYCCSLNFQCHFNSDLCYHVRAKDFPTQISLVQGGHANSLKAAWCGSEFCLSCAFIHRYTIDNQPFIYFFDLCNLAEILLMQSHL